MRAKTGVISSLDRRDFLKMTLATTAIAASATVAGAQRPGGGSAGMIDVNVNLSRWLLRRLRGDDTSALVAMLHRHNVVQAWAGTFDVLLHKDLASANARLADQCHRHGRGVLVPFGSINPKSPDWKEDLRRCAEEHRMAGIRLHPN